MSSETAQVYQQYSSDPSLDFAAVEPEGEAYRHAVIGVFDTHLQAEHMLKKLEQSGYSLRQLSIVGKGYHSEERPLGFYTVGDRIKSWGSAGLLWGGFWGLLFGAAFFWLPDIGPVTVAGPFIHLLVTGVEGAAVVGGLSVVGAALVSLGMPRKDVVKYERLLKADRFLVIAHGSELEILKAQYLMEQEKAAQTATVGG